MNKKIIFSCLLACLVQEQKMHSYYGGGGEFVGGFATGALIGSVAASSAARYPRDPRYDLEKAKADQELREMKAQDRIRREDERQEKIQRREDERQEREHQRRLKQKQRDQEKKRSKSHDKEEIAPTKKKQKTTQQNALTHSQKKQSKPQQPIQIKKEAQSPEDLQLEIKKLELEIAQLKHSQAIASA